jgi:hypothetical protein
MKTLPSATRPREGKIDRNTVNNSVLLLLDERKEKHPLLLIYLADGNFEV